MATGVLPFTIPASITTPDSVETRLGTLKFFDGLPDEATVKTLYDNLDFQRGVQAFLSAIPAASSFAIRAAFRLSGPDNETVCITESLADSHELFLTANSETVYNFAWLDAKDGPLVIEMPPNVLGFIDDFFMRFVGDVGFVGPDKGKGGKYLLIPPGFSGDVPDGYFVLRPRTFGNVLCFRAFVTNGDLQPAIENTKANFRAYPLARATSRPAMRFVNISGASFNSVFANDITFFDQVSQVVEEEPLDAFDPELRGLLAAIGIRKGKPFAPDARMKRILVEAVAVGNATARAIVFNTRDKAAFYYPNSAWKMIWIGNDPDFSAGGTLNLDARTFYCYMGAGVSPALTVKMVGAGSQYAFAERDATGHYLDGGKSYRLHLPPNIPAKAFWSLIVYDPQTRSMLQTEHPFPSVSSQRENLAVNADGSVDIYFGPSALLGKESNWIETIPEKGWFCYLRLYSPLEPWFDKTWRPGEIELLG
jgi:hypothetical protein